MDGPFNRTNRSADEALQSLVAGNERFRNGTGRSSKATPADLAKLAYGQQPFATILGCSDSRVAPEIIFDAYLGELFVVRVAGNVLSPEGGGSLQYAGSHLHTPLFVVLGHEGCGAISAALASRDHGAQPKSRIQFLVNSILPSLPDLDPESSPEARLSKAVESNVRFTVKNIHESPEGQMRQAEGRMKVVGAIYDIATGQVRFLDQIALTAGSV
jgi:carbonic anhydrase